MQMPLVAVQHALPPAQLSIGMAVVVFSQFFVGALFLALGETVFSSSLTNALRTFAPDVSDELVNQAGATAVRHVVSKKQLPGVLLAYSKAIDHVFYLAAGLTVLTFVFAWGMGWKSVKKTKTVKPDGG